jgi:hypothetical protein
MVTAAWNSWRNGLGGVPPSPADIVRQALRIVQQFGHLMRFLG